MFLSELQDKSIVNIDDGKLIGNIIDIIINEDGFIKSLVVEKTKFIVSRFTSKDEMNIEWKKIEKIGEDVILVKMDI